MVIFELSKLVVAKLTKGIVSFHLHLMETVLALKSYMHQEVTYSEKSYWCSQWYPQALCQIDAQLSCCCQNNNKQATKQKYQA